MIEPHLPASQVSNVEQEYETQKALFENQPVIIQRFLEIQGRQIAEGLLNNPLSVRFSLPDRIVTQIKRINETVSIALPKEGREQIVGNLVGRLTRRNLRDEISHRLNELEQSPDQAVAVSAGLLRYAAATYMISSMLPDGRTVTYITDGDEAIATIPAPDESLESAITQDSDAIAEEGAQDGKRGDLQVPFVPAARRFYLPQWVAFGENNDLLVSSVDEAESHLLSMQQYATILHRAVALAAYMVANEEYQRKRYGILGQLINQGRALAKYRTREIIQKIKERVARHSLNRGLSLDLPFFNDQNLAMENRHIQVIPAGRIMFVPALLVRAANDEQVKVAQDTRLSSSTRKHLLEQLELLATAFKFTQS